MKTDNKILQLSFDFSLLVIEIYKKLIQQNEYVLSKQLLRSATSIGANVEEAHCCSNEERFHHKDGNSFKRGTGNKVLDQVAGQKQNGGLGLFSLSKSSRAHHQHSYKNCKDHSAKHLKFIIQHSA